MGGWNDIPSQYKPHWSTWKIEGTPLEETQKRLHARGLHDPWLRNEAWGYKIPGRHSPLTKLLSRGMKSGFVLFLGIIAAEKMFFPTTPHH